MTSERYVLLGLAPARTAWFDSVAQWANSATIAAEFVKCVSVEELRARLASGRRHSCVLVDAAMASLDRDLVQTAADAQTPVLVVRDRRSPKFSTVDIGAAGELSAEFGPRELLDVLSVNCRPVGRAEELPPGLAEAVQPPWLAQLFAVCGSGGTGTSTVAIALAQGLASDVRYGGRVVLADLARQAEQAMLHDATDLGPGIQELVDAHRLGAPDPEEVRRMTFAVPRRGYRLLLGLRRSDAWSALRPRSIDAAIDGLRRAFQVVVCDVTADFEGESQGGSADVEDRNHLARAAVCRSAVVVAVGMPGLKGVHSLARLIRSLVEAGVAGERIVAVFNRSPRNPRARAESARALSALLEGEGTLRAVPRLAIAAPLALPERKVEDALRDCEPMPAGLVEPITRAVEAVAERVADEPPASAKPQRIAPGSLGTWPEEWAAGGWPDAGDYQTGDA